MKTLLISTIWLLFLLAWFTEGKKKKEEPFEPITSMRRITPQVVEKERDGSFDKQVVYITFRESYIDQYGILELANGVKRGLKTY